jgi:hypothetical protein
MEQSLRIPKYVLLILLFIMTLGIKFSNTSSSDYKINKYITAYLVLIVAYVFYGMMNNADDFLNQFEAYFIFPVIYYFTFRGFNINHKNISRVIHFSLWTIIAQGVFIYLATVYLNISTGFNGLDVPFLSSIYVYNPLANEFSFPGLNSLPYLIPFVLANASYRGVKLKRFVLMYLLGIVIAYISGRAGILMVAAVTGGILLFKQFKGISKATIGILLTICLIYFAISSGRANIIEKSNIIRFEQFFYLWDEFTKNIFFGNGFGTHPEYIRSSVKPSSYELYYMSLLGQLGVIGLVLMYFLISRVVYSARNQRNFWFYSNIYGILGFLIASLSNPYFDRFDAIFVLFIFL